MENIKLINYVITNTYFDFDFDEEHEVGLEVKEEVSLKLPKDPNDTTFLLISETTIEDLEKKHVRIVIKANAYFDCGQKLATYDETIQRQCIPMLFEKAAQTIDSVLEVLNYPKLNLESKMPKT